MLVFRKLSLEVPTPRWQSLNRTYLELSLRGSFNAPSNAFEILVSYPIIIASYSHNGEYIFVCSHEHTLSFEMQTEENSKDREADLKKDKMVE